MPTRAPAAPRARGPRRIGLLLAGLVMVLAGLGLGIAIVTWGNDRAHDAAQRLVRASAGCVTTLRLDRPGSYQVYAERRATILPSDVQCAGAPTKVDAPADAPLPGVVVRTPAGDAVIIEPASGEEYDLDEFRGQLIGRFSSDSDLTLTVSVRAGESPLVVAIGASSSSPGRMVDRFQMAAGAAALCGAAVGLPMMLAGARRRRLPPAGAATRSAWPPQLASHTQYSAPTPPAPPPASSQAPPPPPPLV